MQYNPSPPGTRWWMHEHSLMRYNPMNAAAGHIRITDGWPAPGVQRFFVRHYLPPDSEPTRDDFRGSFSEAIQLAEEWMP